MIETRDEDIKSGTDKSANKLRGRGMTSPMERQQRARLSAIELEHRGRASAIEVQQFAGKLSTGILAVFFYTLTTKVEPALTASQTCLLLAGTVCMFFATASTIISWFADAKWNTSLALAQTTTDKSKKGVLFRRCDKWKTVDVRVGLVCL